ncbi:MAG: flagellar hook-length control protein FliK [Enterocloster aldenensis]
MNTGTFTQIAADSSYKTAQASGSLSGRGKQAAAVYFADVFARSLRDDGRTPDTKTSAGKQEHGLDAKARHTEKQDPVRSDVRRQTADQDGKSGGGADRNLEDGSGAAADAVDKTAAGNAGNDGDAQNRTDDGLNLEAAMSLQAMMAFLQYGDPDIQDGGAQTAGKTDGQITVQAGTVLQTVREEQDISPVLAAMAGADDQERVSGQDMRRAAVSGAEEPSVGQTAGQDRTEADRTGRFSRTMKASDEAGTAVCGEASVKGSTQPPQSGIESHTFLQGRQELVRAMGQEQELSAAADGDTGTANQVLEELKRNAAAGGLNLTDRMNQNRLNPGFGMNQVKEGQEQQVPVLEQLKTGLEQGIKTGMKELTVHLKPEGLGDIVIHLVGTGEKMWVRIGVANPETEKLVTSQMESLKDMLRPLDTEVAEVYHDSRGTMDFAGYDQQMQDHRGQQSQSHYRYYGRDDNAGPDEDFLMEAGRMTAQSRMSRLYAYV